MRLNQNRGVKSQSGFRTAARRVDRWSGAVRLLMLPVMAAAAFGLAGCGQEDSKFADMVDSFHKKLDDKDKELADLRESESQLQQQVSALNQQLKDAQGQGGGAGAPDPQKLADVLTPIIQRAVHDALANNGQMQPSMTAPAPAPAPSEPAPRPAPAEVTTRPADGGDQGDVQHYNIDFPK